MYSFLLLLAVTAVSTGATLFADHVGCVPTLNALFCVFVLDQVHYFFLLFLKPPKCPFFFGCVMWMTFIASRAKECVLRSARRRARTFVGFIRGRALRRPMAKALM